MGQAGMDPGATVTRCWDGAGHPSSLGHLVTLRYPNLSFYSIAFIWGILISVLAGVWFFWGRMWVVWTPLGERHR